MSACPVSATGVRGPQNERREPDSGNYYAGIEEVRHKTRSRLL